MTRVRDHDLHEVGGMLDQGTKGSLVYSISREFRDPLTQSIVYINRKKITQNLQENTPRRLTRRETTKGVQAQIEPSP
jgi:hypothetical protein